MAWLLDKEVRRDLPNEWMGVVPSEVFIHEAQETVEKARDIAISNGLKYVYVGNVPRGHKGGISYCPNCNELLIKRWKCFLLIKNFVKFQVL